MFIAFTLPLLPETSIISRTLKGRLKRIKTPAIIFPKTYCAAIPKTMVEAPALAKSECAYEDEIGNERNAQPKPKR